MTLAAHFRSEEWSHAELAREVNRLLDDSGLSRPRVPVRFHDHERSYRELADALNEMLGNYRIIADPAFDDASAWTINTTAGSASVTGGQLVCTNWTGTARPAPAVTAVIGSNYSWNIIVSSTDAASLQGIQFGDIDALGGSNYLWLGGLGAGTFTGTGPAVAATTPLIFIGFGTSNLTVDHFEISRRFEYRVPAHFETPEKSYRVLYDAVRMLQ